MAVYFEGKGNAQGGDQLIDAARGGDADADLVLRDVARDMIKRNVALAEPLAGYVLGILDGSALPKRRRGCPPRKRKNFDRDYFIGTAVERTIALGYTLTRNSATRDLHPLRHSACSIVASALQRIKIEDAPGEAGVEVIWRKYDQTWVRTAACSRCELSSLPNVRL